MEYLDNPFKVINGEIKECFKRVEGGDYELADTHSGEVNVFRKAAKNKRVMVDTGNYVKFFRGGLMSILKLSPASVQIVLYIAINLRPHTDNIILECSTVCGYIGNFGERTFYRAISELLEKNIIARKKGSSIEFFLNINFVFNGSRLKIK